jgi:hypothetical protein
VLPNRTASRSWVWTARCQFTPSVGSACRKSTPFIGFAQLYGDEWNLGGGRSTSGSVHMSVSSRGVLKIAGAFRSAPPCDESGCLGRGANTWVRGYPGAVYGIVQCRPNSVARESPMLRLPMRVDAIPTDLIATTTYAVHARRVTYDVAYDMWLNDSKTRSPCLTNGTVEVMVWTDYDNAALLPGNDPAATATVPFSMNGVVHSGSGAWAIYVDNVYAHGRTAPWGGTLFFILHRPYVVSRGTVSVDLSAVFTAASQLLEEDFHWTNVSAHYWLDTIPFGMEFGPPNGAVSSSGPVDFGLDVSSFCLETGTTVARARCGASR